MTATNLEERLRVIAPLWGYLPAFRVVAECEHLPTAARMLDVTTSTLSRSIASLERALGRELFERSGRSLRLGKHGHILLETVRDSMRWLDDCVGRLQGEGHRGPFRVASGGAGTTAIVAPRLAELRQRHPDLVPQIFSPDHQATPQHLLRGALDIAFQETEVSQPGLVTERVCEIGRGVYCGRSHSLFDKPDVTAEDLHGAEFVAPPGDGTRESIDGWPGTIPRTIAMVVDQVRVGLEVCAALPLLAVLPHVLAEERGDALRRLPIDVIPAGELYAIYRRPLGARSTPATELVALLRGHGRMEA
ncbi:MAG: LysR family transcriptional regulator [bacterium]|nr:LysR family transcriptional regulator [bacterium]